MMSTRQEQTFKTSPAGIALIKRFEGIRLTAYQDVVGVWTIGFGDTLNVRPGLTITLADAEARLRRRLAIEFEPGVRRYANHPKTTQNMFDAMISLTYNIGVGRPETHDQGGTGFASSSVARLHRQGEFAHAAYAFRLWNKAGGQVLEPLIRRRKAEAELYLTFIPH